MCIVTIAEFYERIYVLRNRPIDEPPLMRATSSYMDIITELEEWKLSAH